MQTDLLIGYKFEGNENKKQKEDKKKEMLTVQYVKYFMINFYNSKLKFNPNLTKFIIISTISIKNK